MAAVLSLLSRCRKHEDLVRLGTSCLLGVAITISVVAVIAVVAPGSVSQGVGSTGIEGLLTGGTPAYQRDPALAATLALIATQQQRCALLSRLALLLDLAMTLLLALLLVLASSQIHRTQGPSKQGKGERMAESSKVSSIVDRLWEINSGRVPVAISYYGEIIEDLKVVTGYIKVLEQRNWPAVRRYADEHLVPAVVENLQESLAELGPILTDINEQLRDLSTQA